MDAAQMMADLGLGRIEELSKCDAGVQSRDRDVEATRKADEARRQAANQPAALQAWNNAGIAPDRKYENQQNLANGQMHRQAQLVSSLSRAQHGAPRPRPIPQPVSTQRQVVPSHGRNHSRALSPSRHGTQVWIRGRRVDKSGWSAFNALLASNSNDEAVTPECESHRTTSGMTIGSDRSSAPPASSQPKPSTQPKPSSQSKPSSQLDAESTARVIIKLFDPKNAAAVKTYRQDHPEHEVYFSLAEKAIRDVKTGHPRIVEVYYRDMATLMERCLFAAAKEMFSSTQAEPAAMESKPVDSPPVEHTTVQLSRPSPGDPYCCTMEDAEWWQSLAVQAVH